MTNFEKALDKLFVLEGYISNNNYDSGGYTFMGISRHYHPEWKGWKCIDKKDYDTAEELTSDFYLKTYWEPLCCDKITSFYVAFNIFQIAVNRDVEPVKNEVQKTCILLGKNIKSDGIIGKHTLRAVNSIDPVEFLEVFLSFSGTHYIDRVTKDETQKIFLHGWLDKRVYRRIFEVINNE